MSKKTNVATSATETTDNDVVKTKNKAAVSKDDSFCCYIGPTITGMIQSGTIYLGTKARVLAELEEVVKKYPLVSSLVVTDKTLSEDRIKVKTPGNILYVNYKKLMSGRN